MWCRGNRKGRGFVRRCAVEPGGVRGMPAGPGPGGRTGGRARPAGPGPAIPVVMWARSQAGFGPWAAFRSTRLFPALFDGPSGRIRRSRPDGDEVSGRAGEPVRQAHRTRVSGVYTGPPLMLVVSLNSA